MIFYYSGTGNSRYIAGELGKHTNEEVVNISALRHKSIPEDILHKIALSEAIGFVFPVYSWGPAPAMVEFVDSLPENTLNGKYCWMTCTCGDDTGMTHRMFAKSVRTKGGNLEAIFSVFMPNNYVLLPGFGVDSKEVEEQKLQQAIPKVRTIADSINQRDMVVDIFCGSWPRIKSSVYPLFKRWGVRPKKWHYTDACIGCGKCAQVCPAHNIAMQKMEDGTLRPKWGNDCLSCCACFHYCPTKAAQYGKITLKAGQYHCP